MTEAEESRCADTFIPAPYTSSRQKPGRAAPKPNYLCVKINLEQNKSPVTRQNRSTQPALRSESVAGPRKRRRSLENEVVPPPDGARGPEVTAAAALTHEHHSSDASGKAGGGPLWRSLSAAPRPAAHPARADNSQVGL